MDWLEIAGLLTGYGPEYTRDRDTADISPTNTLWNDVIDCIVASCPELIIKDNMVAHLDWSKARSRRTIPLAIPQARGARARRRVWLGIHNRPFLRARTTQREAYNVYI